MDWTQILKRSGIPESPGRQQAVAAAVQHACERRQQAAAKPSTRTGARK